MFVFILNNIKFPNLAVFRLLDRLKTSDIIVLNTHRSIINRYLYHLLVSRKKSSLPANFYNIKRVSREEKTYVVMLLAGGQGGLKPTRNLGVQFTLF